MQLPNQGLDSFSSIEKALNDVRNLLWVRFSQANYLASISTAFGDTWNINDLDDLITPWKQGNFSRLPAIEVRPAVEISGADGAFSSDTGRIYLAAEYISAHRNDQSAIQRLLLEEIGHFIDAQINPVDAPGDEGALFAALILGEELSQGELKSLREEDDSGVATVNGAEISIEQADVNAPHQLSGGTNGDTTTIDLGGTSGEITLEFNSLYNLDRIQLFFEGEYLPFFDSDEIPWNGSFSRVIPFNGDSREIIVRVLSDTEQPSGTALWGYEISSEIDETEEPFIPPVEVRNLTIEDRDVETGEFFESDRIVDGNKAKVSAIIKHNENSSREIEVFVEGLFKDSSSKIIRRIIGEPKTIFLSGKDTQEVEFSWDTTGFAWETGNQPASDRDIQIIVRDANSPENTKPLATSQESVEIIPQPVVLAHGLWSNAEAWDSYIASDGFLAEVHPQWQGFAVDTMNTGSSIFDLVNPFANTPNSINENSEELNKFIDQVRLNTNAENVDIVAHSMGGLISRKYIQDLMPLVDNDEPVVDELIMLGTPNNGSPLADVLFSGILLSKVTKGEFLSAQSASEEYANIYQLQTEYLKNVFNPRVYDRKDVDFSILAGVNIPLPINPPLSDESASPSYLSGIGDGVVPESNALYINRVENGKLTQELIQENVRISGLKHTSMTESKPAFKEHVLRWLADDPDEVNQNNSSPESDGEALLELTPPPPAPTTNDESLESQVIFGDFTELPGDGSVEVEIPVAQADIFGITYLASENITSRLIAPDGTTVIKETLAGSPESQQLIRSYVVDAPVAGNYTLELSQEGGTDTNILISALVTGDPLALETEVVTDADGEVQVFADLLNGAVPVIGGDVTAFLLGADGSELEVALFDDGLNEDGAADDGRYGAVLPDLPLDAYELVVTARGTDAENIDFARATYEFIAVPQSDSNDGQAPGEDEDDTNDSNTPSPKPRLEDPAFLPGKLQEFLTEFDNFLSNLQEGLDKAAKQEFPLIDNPLDEITWISDLRREISQLDTTFDKTIVGFKDRLNDLLPDFLTASYDAGDDSLKIEFTDQQDIISGEFLSADTVDSVSIANFNLAEKIDVGLTYTLKGDQDGADNWTFYFMPEGGESYSQNNFDRLGLGLDFDFQNLRSDLNIGGLNFKVEGVKDSEGRDVSSLNLGMDVGIAPNNLGEILNRGKFNANDVETEIQFDLKFSADEIKLPNFIATDTNKNFDFPEIYSTLNIGFNEALGINKFELDGVITSEAFFDDLSRGIEIVTLPFAHLFREENQTGDSEIIGIFDRDFKTLTDRKWFKEIIDGFNHETHPDFRSNPKIENDWDGVNRVTLLDILAYWDATDNAAIEIEKIMDAYNGIFREIEGEYDINGNLVQEGYKQTYNKDQWERFDGQKVSGQSFGFSLISPNTAPPPQQSSLNAQSGNAEDFNPEYYFPLFSDTKTEFQKLLQGKPADLFKLELLDEPYRLFSVQEEVTFEFFKFLNINFGFEASGDLWLGPIGFDTEGLQRFTTSGDALDIFQGFYVSDEGYLYDPQGRPIRDNNGQQVWGDADELAFRAKLSAGASLDAFVAEAGVDGYIGAQLAFNFDDTNADGKIRPYEFDINPFKLFEGRFDTYAGIEAFFEVGLGPFNKRWDWELAETQLLDPIEFGGRRDTPNLAGYVANVDDTKALLLHAGKYADERSEGLKSGQTGADEFILITQTGPNTIQVDAFGEQQTFGDVSEVAVDTGDGHDTVQFNHGSGVSSSEWLSANMRGGDGNDQLTGGNADDFIEGEADDDALYGRGGNDQVLGGTGNDRAYGGDGNDQIFGGDGDDRAYGGDGDDRAYGGDGDDQIFGGDGIDILEGGGGIDFLEGGSGDDVIAGEAGDDKDLRDKESGKLLVRGGLYGGDGDDTLDGGLGADFLDGGADEDKLWGGAGNDLLYGGEGDHKDFLYGEAGDDELDGQGGDDELYGGFGNDTLKGRSGNNTLEGGAGDDILDVRGYGGQNTLRGGQGSDTAYGGLDRDLIEGGTEDDSLFGYEGDDTIKGEQGSDTIEAGAGADFVEGGLDNDTILGGTGTDRIFGEEDAAELTAIAGIDYGDEIYGGDGADEIYGQLGRDEIYGDAGADILDGGDDNDTIEGGAGHDALYGSTGDDTLYGFNDSDKDDNQAEGSAEEDDIFYGGDGDDKIYGGIGNDILYGDDTDDRALLDKAGNDNLYGGMGNDELYGRLGDDILNGGEGDDWLNGGVGNDLLIGGADNDVFVLSPGSGLDLIQDFHLGWELEEDPRDPENKLIRVNYPEKEDVIRLSDGLSFNFVSVESYSEAKLRDDPSLLQDDGSFIAEIQELIKQIKKPNESTLIRDLDTGSFLAIFDGIREGDLGRKYFDEENVPPNRLDFKSKKPIYARTETVELVDTVVRDANGTNDLEKVEFWLKREGGAWEDIKDLGFKGIDGSAEWGDYDGDGDADILISGVNPERDTYHTRIYNNVDGNFVEVDLALPVTPLSKHGVTWEDVDSDGDLDILGYNFIAKQQDGTFESATEVTSELANTDPQSVLWTDYDGDDRLDMLVIGQEQPRFASDEPKPVFKAFSENEAGVFEEVDTSSLDAVSTIYNPSFTWFDSRNTGETNLNLSGKTQKINLEDYPDANNDLGSATIQLINGNILEVSQRIITEDGSSSQVAIEAQLFNSEAQPLGEKIRVSDNPLGLYQYTVTTQPKRNGGFAIGWERKQLFPWPPDYHENTKLYVRQYDADARSTHDSEILVASTEYFNTPSYQVFEDGSLLASWVDEYGEGTFAESWYVQRFFPDGSSLEKQLIGQASTEYYSYEEKLILDREIIPRDGGEFTAVYVFQDDSTGEYVVRANLFGESGELISESSDRISDYQLRRNIQDLRIQVNDDNGYSIIWESDGQGYARKYTPDGNVILQKQLLKNEAGVFSNTELPEFLQDEGIIPDLVSSSEPINAEGDRLLLVTTTKPSGDVNLDAKYIENYREARGFGISQIYKVDIDGNYELLASSPENSGAPPTSSLVGVIDASADWVTLDGNTFLVMTGATNELRQRAETSDNVEFSRMPTTQLYRFDKEVGLVQLEHTLPELVSQSPGTSVSWHDYDGDGDPDLLLNGRDFFENPLTKVFRNEGYGILRNGWRQSDPDTQNLTGVNDKQDVFVLDTTPGIEIIENFEAGRDLLYLDSANNPDLTFENLTFEQNGDDVEVQFQGNTIARLVNRRLAAIDSENPDAKAIGNTPTTHQELFVVALEKDQSAQTITNFETGKDFLYLRNGLSLEALTFTAEAGDTKIEHDGNLLATLAGTSVLTLSQALISSPIETTFDVDRDFLVFDGGLKASDLIITPKETEEDTNTTTLKVQYRDPAIEEDADQPVIATLQLANGKTLADFNRQQFGREPIVTEQLNLVDAVFSPLPSNPNDTRLGTFEYTLDETEIERPTSAEDQPIDYELKGIASDHQIAEEEYIFLTPSREPAPNGNPLTQLGNIFQVDGRASFADTPSDQSALSVTALANGNFVTAWKAQGDGSIYTQLHTPDGNKLSGPMRVNQSTSGFWNQGAPKVIAQGSEGYIVTWEAGGEGSDENNQGIYYRRFDNSGNSIGGEFLIDDGSPYRQDDPAIATLADGSFVISWVSLAKASNLSRGTYSIQYQLFNADGTPKSSVNQVGTTGESGQPSFQDVGYFGPSSKVEVAALRDGGFAIAWENAGDIFVQQYAANGDVLGGPTRVNNVTPGEQSNPVITGLTNGGFVVAWESDNTSRLGVNGRRFGSDGQAMGSEFVIDNGYEWRQNRSGSWYRVHADDPSVTALQDGGFLVAWDWLGYSTRAQRFLDNGQASGDPVVIKADSRWPDTTTLADGRVVVVSADQAQTDLIHARIVDPAWHPYVVIDTSNLESNETPFITLGDANSQFHQYSEDGTGRTAVVDLTGNADFKMQLHGTADQYKYETVTINNGVEGVFDVDININSLFPSELIKELTRRYGTGAQVTALFYSPHPRGWNKRANSKYVPAGDDVYLAAVIAGVRESAIAFPEGDTPGTLQFVSEYQDSTEKISFTINNRGEEAAEEIPGDDTDDILTGGGGNDTIEGKGGVDYIDGGFGDDKLYAVSSTSNDEEASVESVEVFANELYGWEGDDLLEGSNLNDLLEGGEGDDTLEGFAGNDLLIGGDGTDTIDGGDGIDTLDYSRSPGSVTVNLPNDPTIDSRDQPKTTDGYGNTDTISNLENVIGSQYADTVIGDGQANELIGLAGDDLLDGADGDDTLRGGPGNDTLAAGSGNNILESGYGADSLSAGANNDTYILGHENAEDDWLSTDEAFTALLGGQKQQRKVLRTANNFEINLDTFRRWGFESEFDKYEEFGLEADLDRRNAGQNWLRFTIQEWLSPAEAFKAIGGGETQLISPATGAVITKTDFLTWAGVDESGEKLKTPNGEDVTPQWEKFQEYGLAVNGLRYETGQAWLGLTTVQAISGSQIQDTGGDDTLILPGEVDPRLQRLYPGLTGFAQVHEVDSEGQQRFHLAIDLNQDGVARHEDDLFIEDFFGDDGYTAGTGFIETIGSRTAKASASLSQGDFTITPTRPQPTLIGDGIDETYHWSFDFTEDFSDASGRHDLSQLKDLSSAKLTLIFTPKDTALSTDTIAIEGLSPFSLKEFDNLPLNKPAVIEINLLDHYIDGEILNALQAGEPGKISFIYHDDSIVTSATLELTPDDSSKLVADAFSGTEITENLSPRFTAISLPTGLENLSKANDWQGTSTWGDIDNDGDLDALITGHDTNGQGIAQIYLNDGNDIFGKRIKELDGSERIEAITIDGLERIDATQWGDYNNDGKLDLLLIGYDSVLDADGNVVGRDYAVRVYQNISKDSQFGIDESDIDFNLARVFWSEDPFSIALSSENTSDVPEIDWKDYDNDGDIDILVTGNVKGQRGTVLYRNTVDAEGQRQYTPSVLGIDQTITNGDVESIDYDNDGDLDLSLTGNGVSQLYQNNGQGQFSLVSDTPFVALSESDASWADYDNDGDFDLLLTGKDTSGQLTSILYNNEDSQFTEQWRTDFSDSIYTLTGPRLGNLSWAEAEAEANALGGHLVTINSKAENDFLVNKFLSDNDNSYWIGLTDVAAEGKFVWSSGEPVSYNNWHPGEPSNSGGGTGEDYAVLNWLGLNKDTWNDTTSSDRRRGIIEIKSPIASVSNPSVDWGDFNNDGNLDVLLTGQRDAQPVTEIYSGDGNGAFTRLADDSFLMTSIKNGEASWGDYDNDGDLDVLISGGAGRDGVPFAQVYRNNLVETEAGQTNKPPTIPTKIDPEYRDDNSVALRWLPNPDSETNLTDDKSDLETLTYSLQVGTSPRASNVMAPLSLDYGKLLTNQVGNVGFGNKEADATGDLVGATQWIIQELEPGETYYWNVQAIDQAGRGSNFESSSEFDFTANFVDWSSGTPVAPEDLTTAIEPNFGDDVLRVTSWQWGDADNDGQRDILMTGVSSEGGILRIYEQGDNELNLVIGETLANGTFQDAQWGDYDNDGYQEILFVGQRQVDGETQNYSGIYQNTDGHLNLSRREKTLGEIDDKDYSVARWGDADNDGYLDVLLVGKTGGKIYFINGGQVGEKPETLEYNNPNEVQDAFWVDYDNDGDLDISLALEYSNGRATEFYSNELYEKVNDDGSREPEVNFSHVLTPDQEGAIVGFTSSEVDESDIETDEVDESDDDSYEPLNIQVVDDDGNISTYQNLVQQSNQAPSAPIVLRTETYGTNVTLTWSPGADEETHVDGLQYNLRIGQWNQEIQAIDWSVVSEADLIEFSQGVLTNGQLDDEELISRTFRNLTDGVYYWSLQTVDAAFVASEWSAPSGFIIGSSELDTDQSPQVGNSYEVVISDTTAREDEGVIEFTVSLFDKNGNPKEVPVGETLDISYRIIAQDALAGEDYTVPDSTTVTFRENTSQAIISIDLDDDDDTLSTLDRESLEEKFWILLEDNQNIFLKDFQGVGTIIDDYVPPLPDLAVVESLTPQEDEEQSQNKLPTVMWGEKFKISATVANIADLEETQLPPSSVAYSIYIYEENNPENAIQVASGWITDNDQDEQDHGFDPDGEGEIPSYEDLDDIDGVYQLGSSPSNETLVAEIAVTPEGNLGDFKKKLGENQNQEYILELRIDPDNSEEEADDVSSDSDSPLPSNNISTTKILVRDNPSVLDLALTNLQAELVELTDASKAVQLEWVTTNAGSEVLEALVDKENESLPAWKTYVFLSKDESLDVEDKLISREQDSNGNLIQYYDEKTESLTYAEGGINPEKITAEISGEDKLVFPDLLPGDAVSQFATVSLPQTNQYRYLLVAVIPEAQSDVNFGSKDSPSNIRYFDLGLDRVLNNPPQAFLSIEPQYAKANDSAYSFTLPDKLFIDSDGDDLIYEATNLPPGLTFNPNNLRFSGLPTEPDQYNITVSVNDSKGGTAVTNFELFVFDQIQTISESSSEGKLEGNAGLDLIDGENANIPLELDGKAGNDLLKGGAAPDSLSGGLGDDILIGNAGNDTLLGGLSDDILIGGSGFDFISGNEGADIFMLSADEGLDYFLDFTKGEDKLGIQSDLQFNKDIFVSTISSPSGSNTRIQDSSGNLLAIVLGTEENLITNEDFISL